MTIDIDPTPEKNKDALLAECVDKGWELLAHQMNELKGEKGGTLRKDINNRFSFIDRHRLSWEEKLDRTAQRKEERHDRLKTEMKARIAVLTANRRNEQVLLALGEDINTIPQGYLSTMRALNASLPWNRSGLDSIMLSLDQPTLKDVQEAVIYVNSQLEKYKKIR